MSTPSFSLVEELFQASNFQCLDMLNFAHGVTSAFGSFFEKMTLFGKLQADQVETTTCRDLRLSKSSWEHLGTVVGSAF